MLDQCNYFRIFFFYTILFFGSSIIKVQFVFALQVYLYPLFNLIFYIYNIFIILFHIHSFFFVFINMIVENSTIFISILIFIFIFSFFFLFNDFRDKLSLAYRHGFLRIFFYRKNFFL